VVAVSIEGGAETGCWPLTVYEKVQKSAVVACSPGDVIVNERMQRVYSQPACLPDRTGPVDDGHCTALSKSPRRTDRPTDQLVASYISCSSHRRSWNWLPSAAQYTVLPSRPITSSHCYLIRSVGHYNSPGSCTYHQVAAV